VLIHTYVHGCRDAVHYIPSRPLIVTALLASSRDTHHDSRLTLTLTLTLCLLCGRLYYLLGYCVVGDTCRLRWLLLDDWG
jgi:hypothetical protein